MQIWQHCLSATNTALFQLYFFLLCDIYSAASYTSVSSKKSYTRHYSTQCIMHSVSVQRVVWDAARASVAHFSGLNLQNVLKAQGCNLIGSQSSLNLKRSFDHRDVTSVTYSHLLMFVGQPDFRMQEIVCCRLINADALDLHLKTYNLPLLFTSSSSSSLVPSPPPFPSLLFYVSSVLSPHPLQLHLIYLLLLSCLRKRTVPDSCLF